MTETFEYHLKTGSGSTRVTLQLEDEKATIVYDFAWMGAELQQYRLNCTHYKQSGNYGILVLDFVEKYISMKENITERLDLSEYGYHVEDYGEQESELSGHYERILYEYIRLPQSEIWFADSPDLEEARQIYNLATWPETFDLFLWLHDPIELEEGEFDGLSVLDALRALDKMKFAATEVQEDK